MTANHKLELAILMTLLSAGLAKAADAPKSSDNRVTVELFAEHPDIVTPTGLAVDSRGRVFVAESHTHFRPDDYDGPPADRILIFQDTNGDGRSDKKTIFHEGFRYVMDIAFHDDGSLYVATRRDIHRLRDTNADDKADEITPIVRLETKGDYPHNGLSGIAFELRGGFHFGLGENLGEPYELIGSDGTTLRGGGEGGSTYWVDDRGGKLRRVSTGWWNPYGMCTDSFGRVFGTDNDPDASPPCRLIQVVQDGDYGYEFRYGRSGRNPLVAWDGEIPGTLPMIAGTGEAPCHIVAYESDALPEDYYGHLLIPSWADHRVEHYALEQRPDRGLVSTQRQVLVQGGDDFRPVGIDVAPDGSVYVSDWVSSSYALHKQGRVWRIRPAAFATQPRPQMPADAVQSRDRRVREAAARELAATPVGQATLAKISVGAAVPQVRATCLQRSVGAFPAAKDIVRDSKSPLELRILAARIALAKGDRLSEVSGRAWPLPIQVEKLLSGSASPVEITSAMESRDPLLKHAVIDSLARSIVSVENGEPPIMANASEVTALLAMSRSRAANPQRADRALDSFLDSDDPTVRFAAIKWVADEKLVELRPKLESLLADSKLDLNSFLAIHVALLRLDGKPAEDRPPAARLIEKIRSEEAPLAIRRFCLRLIDPQFPELRFEDLAKLVDHSDEQLRLEALRTLVQHPDRRRTELLASLATNESAGEEARLVAISGLAMNSSDYRQILIDLTQSKVVNVRWEALRALVGDALTDRQRTAVASAIPSGNTSEAVSRIVEKSLPQRPAATDTAAWLKLLPATGDANRGERLFFHPKIAMCSKCHQANGRGAAVGPDLSRIHERIAQAGPDGRRWLLETILQPSRDMAPQYTPWTIVTKDGKQMTGLPRRKGGNSEAYLGSDGLEFTLKTKDIEFHRESDVSIMPADLLQQLTTQELADLFAFLSDS
jgi:putative membrane-bound dehydrogenase-like protein